MPLLCMVRTSSSRFASDSRRPVAVSKTKALSRPLMPNRTEPDWPMCSIPSTMRLESTSRKIDPALPSIITRLNPAPSGTRERSPIPTSTPRRPSHQAAYPRKKIPPYSRSAKGSHLAATTRARRVDSSGAGSERVRAPRSTAARLAPIRPAMHQKRRTTPIPTATHRPAIANRAPMQSIHSRRHSPYLRAATDTNVDSFRESILRPRGEAWPRLVPRAASTCPERVAGERAREEERPRCPPPPTRASARRRSRRVASRALMMRTMPPRSVKLTTRTRPSEEWPTRISLPPERSPSDAGATRWTQPTANGDSYGREPL